MAADVPSGHAGFASHQRAAVHRFRHPFPFSGRPMLTGHSLV